MKIKYLLVFVMVMLVFGLLGNVGLVEASKTDIVPEEENTGEIVPNGYWEAWATWSKRQLSDVYGSWIHGPEGTGPATLTLSKSHTVSNSYSGTLKVSKSVLDAYVGFNTTASWTETASYSVYVPAGETWRIIYRSRFNRWEVVQRKYIKMDGQTFWTNEYAYVYPRKWSNWSFSYIKL